MSLQRARGRVRRGNVILEFGLAFPLLVTFMSGMFQFGYGFFVYNQLQSAIRTGARYGSTADFDGAGAGADYTTRVRNMVVYGTPTAGSVEVVRGLSPVNVAVNWVADGVGIPQVVTVNIQAYNLWAVWGTFTLTNKPRSVFIYLGQYLS